MAATHAQLLHVWRGQELARSTPISLLSLPSHSQRGHHDHTIMFFFQASVPGYIVYMGKDKFEVSTACHLSCTCIRFS
jgi:hypothetical protein